MSNTLFSFRAIAPISSPLSLKLGVNQFSALFIKSLRQMDTSNLSNLEGVFRGFGGLQDEDREYSSTDEDSKDVCLMNWRPNNNEHILFSVYPNNIAVVEVQLEFLFSELINSETAQFLSMEDIEKAVQDRATLLIEQYFDSFIHDLNLLKSLLPRDLVLSDSVQNKIYWIARTLIIHNDQISSPEMGVFLTNWLKKTNRPEDAEDILAGRKKYSLTWLNYAIRNPEPIGHDPYLKIMVLCQYYYVSQEHCNTELMNSIETTYAHTNKVTVGESLARTRTACRLNQISFYENIKYMSRPNRALLESILEGWQFYQLVENSERMIEVCDVRLQEKDNAKRERSSTMTDFLLVALSFFAVFELSLYLTEFSREMMSRPTLHYNDNKSSFFLSYIAEIDADIMFSFGFGLTLFLIIVYRYLKRN